MGNAITGQITVVNKDVPVQGGDEIAGLGFYIRADPNNSGLIWVGNDGENSVSGANGYGLASTDQVFVYTNNLNNLLFVAEKDGDKAHWLRS